MTDRQAKTAAMQAMGRMYKFIKGKFRVTGLPDRNGNAYPADLIEREIREVEAREVQQLRNFRLTMIDGQPWVVICDPHLTVRGTIVE